MAATAFASLKADEIGRRSASMIAVLPIGALEQHGPHLPVGTDFFIAGALAARAVKLVDPAFEVTVLPALAVSASLEHTDRPGAISLSYASLHAMLMDIGLSLAASGFCKILFLNAHGGNSGTLLNVTTELRQKAKLLAVTTNGSRFGEPEGLIDPKARALDIHGGFVETSLMLAIRPDLVAMDRAENFTNRQSAHLARDVHLRAYGSAGYGWMASDLNPAGVMGDAASATREAGEAILDHQARGVARLIEEIAAMTIDHIEGVTGGEEPSGDAIVETVAQTGDEA